MKRTHFFWLPWSLVSPALLVLLGLSIAPLIYLLMYSFTNFQLLTGIARFIGLQNYGHALTSALFWHGLGLTMEFVAAVLLVQVPVAFFLALALFRLKKGAQLISTLLLIPAIISPAVASFQWIQLFDYHFGPINYLLQVLHLGHPLWTASPTLAMPSLLIVDFWEWTPFVMLLLYAGLNSLPSSIFEAARVDGSTYWQTIWNIVLPMLRPVLMVAIILRLVSVFKVFDTIYAMTGGGPGVATEDLAFYTYQQAFQFFNISYAGAIAFVQLIFVTALAKLFLGLDPSLRQAPKRPRRRAPSASPNPAPERMITP